MRPPGGYTTDMFNYACDIDVYGLWARVMRDGSAPLDYQRKYHGCYASRKKRYRYLHDHQAVMETFGSHMAATVRVPGVFSSALGDAGYIFRAKEMTTIETIVTYIHATSEEA